MPRRRAWRTRSPYRRGTHRRSPTPDQTRTGVNGDTITLDGSGSIDVDGDPLTYHWAFLTTPATSSALLVNAAAVNPSFAIDVSGDYVVQLVVNDGVVDSVADRSP